jgi:putative sterol carrier protein
MNKFTKKELVDLILYNFDKKDKKEIKKKMKKNIDFDDEDDDDDDDDFNLKSKIGNLQSKINIDDVEHNFLNEFDNLFGNIGDKKKNDFYDILNTDTDPLVDFGSGKSSNVQSVLIPKNKFSKEEAINYIKEHFKFKKIDDNQRKNFYSFRQFKPTKGSNYSTKKLNNGVELVLEYKKSGGSLPVKTIYKSIVNGYSYPKIEDLDDGFVFSKYGSDKEIQLYVNEKEKRIIINFIGTYTMFDWSNNYYYVLGKYKETKRFKRARDAFIKLSDDYQGYKIILVGHSQSAVITNILNQEFPNKIYEVINLNGANLGETERDNEYNIRSKMDLVSLLHKPTSRDTIINNKTNNILTEHKPDVLKRLDQNKKIGR